MWILVSMRSLTTIECLSLLYWRGSLSWRWVPHKHCCSLHVSWLQGCYVSAVCHALCLCFACCCRSTWIVLRFVLSLWMSCLLSCHHHSIHIWLIICSYTILWLDMPQHNLISLILVQALPNIKGYVESEECRKLSVNNFNALWIGYHWGCVYIWWERIADNIRTNAIDVSADNSSCMHALCACEL